MSAPRLLTIAEVTRWAAAVRGGNPLGATPPEVIRGFENVIATALNGAVDRRREDVEAIERESASIARHLLDQARRG